MDAATVADLTAKIASRQRSDFRLPRHGVAASTRWKRHQRWRPGKGLPVRVDSRSKDREAEASESKRGRDEGWFAGCEGGLVAGPPAVDADEDDRRSPTGYRRGQVGVEGERRVADSPVGNVSLDSGTSMRGGNAERDRQRCDGREETDQIDAHVWRLSRQLRCSRRVRPPRRSRSSTPRRAAETYVVRRLARREAC